jgi:hypothetical protein
MKRALLLVLFYVGVATAQSQPIQSSAPQGFLIDPSIPYVYLKLDHVGPRTPLREGEPSTGTWLRIVNNCRIPITFDTVSASEPVLFDQVVAVRPPRRVIVSESPEAPLMHKDTLEKKHKPDGYDAEVYQSVSVGPGESLMFSVPRNHVDPDRCMRIEFQLKVGKYPAFGPRTYLTFEYWDIPEKQR